MESDNRLTIFVASPDSYSDVFTIFLDCFKKYWSDCPYKFLLATNTKKYDGINVICNNKKNDSWTERTLWALNEIDTKYILLMNDDIFIVDYVDNNEINYILDMMDKHSINFCRLKAGKNGIPLEKDSYIFKTHKQQPYGKNLQVGIFNTEYFKSILGDGSKSAWDLEKQWIADTLSAPDEYFEDITFCKKNVIKTIHGIAKGMWFPSALKKLTKLGITYTGNRKKLSYFEDRKMRITSTLGKMLSPKSRKRIKNLLSKVFKIKFVTKN